MSTPLDTLKVTRIAHHDGSLQYRFTYFSAAVPGQYPLSSYHEQQIEREDLDQALINAAVPVWYFDPGQPRADAGEIPLHHLGQRLARSYLPPPLVDLLFGSTTPLLIETDDPEFPWELVIQNDVPLGIARSVGRAIPGLTPSLRTRTTTRTATLFSAMPDAAPARQEMTHIASALAQAGWEVTPIAGTQATRMQLSTVLETDLDLLHIAGHISFDEQQHDASAITCFDSTLDAATIATLGGTASILIANGCWGGRTAQTDANLVPSAITSFSARGQSVRGLAVAFLERGTVIFISTLWPIFDTSAHAFAQTLYHALLTPQVTVGEALRKTRDLFFKKTDHDPTWGGYILYGDPRHTLATAITPGEPAFSAGVAATSTIFVPPSPLIAQRSPLRLARTAAFFQRIVSDPTILLEASVEAALDTTLDFLDATQHSTAGRLDLLVGLAAIPDGRLARALASIPVTSKLVARLVRLLYGMGNGTSTEPKANAGARGALQRAAKRAARDQRTTITEDDLLTALLEGDAAPSIVALCSVLGIAPAAVLARTRDNGPVLAARPAVVPSQVFSEMQRADARRDAVPTHLLTDLRHQIARQLQEHTLPPFVAPRQAMRDLLTTVAHPTDHHVALRGPAGVGKTTLARGTITYAIQYPASSQVRTLQEWNLYQLRLTRTWPDMQRHLLAELTALAHDTLLWIEDLPQLLTFAGIPATIEQILHHPRLRCLVTLTDDAWETLRATYPAIAIRLAPVSLAPPSRSDTQAILALHAERLAQVHAVTITPDAIAAAIEVAGQEHPLVLPGAAVVRLERACILASEAGGPADGGTNTFLEPARQVTSEQVRHATLDHFRSYGGQS